MAQAQPRTGRAQAFPPGPKRLDTTVRRPNDGCPWLVHRDGAGVVRVVARMIRLRLGVDDVARTRFAAPRPYCELSVSAQVIQQPTSSFRRLCTARGLRLPSSAGRLFELVPAHGNVPDFLVPEGAHSVEEAVDVVMATPGEVIRDDVATLPRAAASSWVLDLADGCASARKELASSFRDYHDHVLEQVWPVLERVLEADLRFRAWQLATRGVAATVDGLHPGIRWRDGVVEVDAPFDADVELAGRGLQLMPSLWTRPGFTARWTQPTLVYPLGRFAWMAPTATRDHGDPLAAVMGTTRARVLRALVDEHTTSGLARALGISLASASTHAAVLRDAGLVTSRRQGQSVCHALTGLGAQWASDGRSATTKAV
jgi:DNA-binding transcriptional ArsR family regulator